MIKNNIQQKQTVSEETNSISFPALVENTFTNSVLDDDHQSTKPEIHQEAIPDNTSFKLEKTPQMGVEHLDKIAPTIADPSIATKPKITDIPVSNWNVEKTILINDDENISASFVRIDTKQRFILDSFPFYIGRAQDCQLKLEDMSLSRQHAKIEKSESGITVEDLDSGNGLKVNDISISQVLLMDGDILTLGHIKLRFELSTNTTQSKKKVREIIAEFLDNINLPQQKQKAREMIDEFLDRINLTHPDWKKYTAAGAGLIATFLVATFFYISTIDDRVLVTEQSTPSKASTSAQTKTTSEKLASSSVVANKATTPTKTSSNRTQSIAPDISNSSAVSETKSKTSIVANETTSQASSTETKFTDSKQSNKPNSTLTTKPAENNKRLSITNARKLYVDGYVTQAIKMLDKLSTTSGVSGKIQNKASLLHGKIVQLKKYYKQGQRAYKRGDKNKAWDAWTAFIIAEKKIRLPKTSKFSETIKLKIVAESLHRDPWDKQTKSKVTQPDKQQASQANLNRQPVATAIIGESKARDLYRDGYRLEHTNLSKAIERWRDVTKLASPSSEYYTKAKAKLRFYEEMNL